MEEGQYLAASGQTPVQEKGLPATLATEPSSEHETGIESVSESSTHVKNSETVASVSELGIASVPSVNDPLVSELLTEASGHGVSDSSVSDSRTGKGLMATTSLEHQLVKDMLVSESLTQVARNLETDVSARDFRDGLGSIEKDTLGSESFTEVSGYSQSDNLPSHSRNWQGSLAATSLEHQLVKDMLDSKSLMEVTDCSKEDFAAQDFGNWQGLIVKDMLGSESFAGVPDHSESSILESASINRQGSMKATLVEHLLANDMLDSESTIEITESLKSDFAARDCKDIQDNQSIKDALCSESSTEVADDSKMDASAGFRGTIAVHMSTKVTQSLETLIEVAGNSKMSVLASGCRFHQGPMVTTSPEHHSVRNIQGLEPLEKVSISSERATEMPPEHQFVKGLPGSESSTENAEDSEIKILPRYSQSFEEPTTAMSMEHQSSSDMLGFEPSIEVVNSEMDISAGDASDCQEQTTTMPLEGHFVEDTLGSKLMEASSNLKTDILASNFIDHVGPTEVISAEHQSTKGTLDESLLQLHLVDAVTSELTMNEKNSFSGPSPSFVRAEIDTASPLKSVKEAVILFGERMEWRSAHQKPLNMEKHNSVEADLRKILEDTVQLKEQLIDTKQATSEILGDLIETKKGLQDLARRQGFQISAEDIATCRADLESAQREAEAELKDVMTEIDSVKVDIRFLAAAKAADQKQSGDLMASWGTMSKRIVELEAMLESANDALASAQMVCMKAEEQNTVLREEIEANERSKVTSTGQKVEMGQSLDSPESSIENPDPIVIEVKEDLCNVRESQDKVVESEAETERDLVVLKFELDRVKAAEIEAVNSLGRVCNEIDAAKANLSHLTDETSSLSSKLELLKMQLHKEMTELESAQKCESSACTRLASFQAELTKVREELISSTSGETRAKDMRHSLPNAIKSNAARADELKAAVKDFKEDIRKAKHETEEARAATRAVESRLQAALKEAEAAKVSEAMAIAEFKALTESEARATVSVSEMETDTALIISLEEYSLLHQKAQEAEELSSKQVAVAFEQVDDAKASQLEAQRRLETINKDIEVTKHTMEKALKKAEEAQSAKLATEGELRRWRAEHEQRRKSGHIPSTQTTAPLLRAQAPPQGRLSNGQELSKSAMLPSPQEGKVMKLDSLAQVLSLKVPAPENPVKVLPLAYLPKEKKRKKTLLHRMAAYVTRKKRQD